MKIQNKNYANHELAINGKLVRGDADGVFTVPDEYGAALLTTKGWTAAEPKGRVARVADESDDEAKDVSGKEQAGPTDEEIAHAAEFVSHLSEYTDRMTAEDAKVGVARFVSTLLNIATDRGRIESVLTPEQRETCESLIARLRDKLIALAAAKAAPKMKGSDANPPSLPPVVADGTTPPTGDDKKL